MKIWKRILVAILLAAFLAPVGVLMAGCDHDHHHHFTDVPAPR